MQHLILRESESTTTTTNDDVLRPAASTTCTCLSKNRGLMVVPANGPVASSGCPAELPDDTVYYNDDLTDYNEPDHAESELCDDEWSDDMTNDIVAH